MMLLKSLNKRCELSQKTFGKWRIPHRQLSMIVKTLFSYLIISIIFFQCLVSMSYAQPEKTHKNVLTIHAQDQFLPANIVMDGTLYKALKSSPNFNISIYSEFLETIRFVSKEMLDKAYELMQTKYSNMKFDLIIITDDISLDFMLDKGTHIFPNVPTVLCGISDGYINISKLNNLITGNFKFVDIRENINTILETQPNTKEIAVVIGKSQQDAYYEKLVRQAFDENIGRVRANYIAGLSLKDTQEKISKLPPDSVILYVTMYFDGNGKGYNPRDVIPLLRQTANRPIYGISETYLGYGIVGGNLVSFVDISQNAADIALRVLNGDRPSSIPIEVSKNKNYFDWQELKRWNIDENSLPVGSIVQNKTLTLWDTNQYQIIGILVFIIIQTILLILLFIQLRRNRKAMKLIATNEARQTEMVSNISDVITIVDKEGNIKYKSPNIEKHFGWEQNDLNGQNYLETVHPDDREVIQNKFVELLEGGKGASTTVEYRYKNKDGSYSPIKLTAVNLINNPDINGILANYHDITEQKLKDEQLIFSSCHDSLTGLYNRRKIKEEIERLQANGDVPISILMGDVNALKLVNDAYGLASGDAVIKKIGEIILEVGGEESICARYGGDEFVAIFPGLSFDEACIKVEDIKNRLSKEQTEKLILSVTFGVATKSDEETTLQSCLKLAEERMYTTKLLDGKNIRSSIIDNLRIALEEKTGETRKHCERMADMSEQLGQKFEFKNFEIANIRLLALLHDIGKTSIPDYIIHKPDKLTDEEYTIIQKHCEIGFRIANTMPEIVPIANDILCHHERWDGNGYPQGIDGENIPLNARIIALLDSFDAMTHDRPYRKAMSHEQAIEEIKRCCGKQFNPEIVKAFLEYIA